MEGSTAEAFFASAEGEDSAADFAQDHITNYERKFDEFGTPLLKRKSLEETTDPVSRHGNGNSNGISRGDGDGDGEASGRHPPPQGQVQGQVQSNGTPAREGGSEAHAAQSSSTHSFSSSRTMTATSTSTTTRTSAADSAATPTHGSAEHGSGSGIMRSPLSTFKLMSQTISEYGDMIAQRRTEIAELQRANQLRLTNSAYPKVNNFHQLQRVSDSAFLTDQFYVFIVLTNTYIYIIAFSLLPSVPHPARANSRSHP
jgi:hypothetical protein